MKLSWATHCYVTPCYVTPFNDRFSISLMSLYKLSFNSKESFRSGLLGKRKTSMRFHKRTRFSSNCCFQLEGASGSCNAKVNPLDIKVKQKSNENIW